MCRLCRGKQFIRCGYAFTPAFGRAVRAFGPSFYGTVETVPFRVVVNLIHEQKRDVGNLAVSVLQGNAIHGRLHTASVHRDRQKYP